MKLGPMVILLIVIQLTIMFFHGAYSTESYTLDPYNSTTIINNTEPSIIEFVLDPVGWSDTSLLVSILSVVGVAGAFAVGVYLVTKSDTVLFLPVATLFFSAGALPIISLYNAFMSNSSLFGCTSLEFCPLAIMLFGLTGGVIAIMYVMAVLSWWSGRVIS